VGNGRSRFDFSLDTIPERWLNAARGSGLSMSPSPLRRRPPRTPVPSAYQHVDPVASFLGGLAVTTVTGIAWYVLEADGTVASPWMLIMVGFVIGLGVRFGGGPYDPGIRAAIALGLYTACVAVVSYLLVHHDLRQSFPNITWAIEERTLVRTRLLAADYALATLGGAWVAVQVNYSWSVRRRPASRQGGR
jgi:hypothetical protein